MGSDNENLLAGLRDKGLRELCKRLSAQGKLERVLIESRETQKSRLRKVKQGLNIKRIL